MPGAGLIAHAQRESMQGDVAFVAAVAAFGQKLRGDPLLGDYRYDAIRQLAAVQRDYWRQGFARLVTLAEAAQRPAGSSPPR